MKICLVASAGGHLNQLLELAESWEGYDIFFITTSKVVKKQLGANGKVYVTGECNRRHPMRVLKVLLLSIIIIIRERPRVVMSTGAACGCIACFLGKLIGAKIVWLDSITNIGKLSLSGRMVGHIANLFLVQWPELAERYKDVEYAGAVI